MLVQPKSLPVRGAQVASDSEHTQMQNAGTSELVERTRRAGRADSAAISVSDTRLPVLAAGLGLGSLSLSSIDTTDMQSYGPLQVSENTIVVQDADEEVIPFGR